MATGPNIQQFPLDLGMRNTSEYQPQPFGAGAALARSINTRLGIIDGVPSKAPSVTSFGTTSGDERRAGIVPSGLGSSLIVAKKYNERATATGHATMIRSYLTASPAPADAFYTYGVTGYGGLHGSFTYSPPAVSFDASGRMWSVEVHALTTGQVSVVVTVTDSSGRLIVAPTTIATTTSVPWVGVTRHDATMVIWWQDGGIKGNRATVNESTLALTLGTGATVYTPLAGGVPSVAVHSDNDSTYAWVVSRHAANANDAAVTRVNISTWGTLTIALTQAAPSLHVAIRHIADGSYSVGVAVKVAAGTCNAYLINGSTMATTWTAAAHAGVGAAAVSFIRELTGDYWMAVASTDYSGTPPTPVAGTWVRRLRMTNGANDGESLLPWKGLISNGTVDSDSTTELRALFALQNLFGNSGAGDPTDPAYVSDPSVEVYRCARSSDATMVARYAVDTALVYPAYLARSAPLEASGDGSFALSYLEDPGALRRGPYNARYVRLATSIPPAYVVDSDGCAMIAPGAAYWDGAEVSEWCPTSRPVIVAETTGGVNVTAAGTWRLSAVVYWEDGTGQLRRSMPANAVTLTTDGVTDQPRIRVTLGATMRDGITKDRSRVLVYASQDGQTALFGQPWNPSAWTDHYVEFDDIIAPLQRADTPAIYTDASPGFPLPAQCPPSFESVAIVGDRMWGLSLGELWYSKPKEPGIAFEFSSELRLAVPAAAGKAYALCELRGSLAMLAERGAWVITGQGPDASLGGSSFNPPEQISDLPCTSRLSVVRTPAGLFFQSGTRFAALGGELGTVLLDDYEADEARTYIGVCLPDTHEVVWFSNDVDYDRFHTVFNYRLRRFTAWDQDVVAGVKSVVVDQVSGVLQFVTSADSLATSDPDSIGNALMTFRTGDIRLGGIEDGDCVVQQTQVTCGWLDDHQAGVSLWEDYAPLSATRTEAFSAPDLVDGQNNKRYTLCVEAKKPSMRALRIQVQLEGTGDCVRPYAVTLVYAQKSGTMTDAVYQAVKR